MEEPVGAGERKEGDGKCKPRAWLLLAGPTHQQRIRGAFTFKFQAPLQLQVQPQEGCVCVSPQAWSLKKVAGTEQMFFHIPGARQSGQCLLTISGGAA